MSQHQFYIFLLLSSCLLISCAKSTPKLEIAREVYKNDLRGIELLNALSAEQKYLVLKNIGSISFDENSHLKKYYGKYSDVWMPEISDNVRSIKTYKQPKKDDRPSKKPKSKLHLLDWTMQTYNQLKENVIALLLNLIQISYLLLSIQQSTFIMKEDCCQVAKKNILIQVTQQK